MHAIRVSRFGSPDVLQWCPIDRLEPATGQILVAVHAVGINPVETYIRAGHYARLPALPYTPGNDAAGVVIKTGAQVNHLQPGNRVYVAGSLTGTYATHTLADADNVHPLPDHCTFAQGAALGVPYITAYHALFQRAHIQAGQTLLVHGATGGVGLATVQWAKAAGLTVLATGGTPQGRQQVIAQGADHVFDHHDRHLPEAVMDITRQRGVDLIVEMLANLNLEQDLAMLSRGGQIAVIGNRGRIEINPRDIMQKRADIKGVMLWLASTQEKQTAHQALYRGLTRGTLAPVIGQTWPLTEAAKAHANLPESGVIGKTVLIPPCP